ncbi:hypothetical protein FVR03_22695 [Pontibacter qinzhouensis]|uniref:Peptidase C39-like domain-containing protein n=1 Tax=Pontibacter qinzhouensis TaxID=2603253 RepID=A0A5C8IQA1_9BACT|nr:hypothetical protein [Pontibacter qinzhouensis]TXK23397.1 hypothetical protein FVR03_22695 [Pontibacter qinzhouensis]
MAIHIIDQLETTECGPEANNGKDYLQEVFLNQGSIDGACGPYSILMGLLALGLADRNEVIAFNTDGRTRLGKLINKLNNDYTSLFKHGTYLDDLEKILLDSYGSLIDVEIRETKNKDLINFTIQHLRENRPTIVGINFSGGGHWMLAVGFEENKEKEIFRLLLLDPSGAKPIVSSWNSIIDLNVTQKGKYPFKWWTNSCHVQFEQAITMWRKS